MTMKMLTEKRKQAQRLKARTKAFVECDLAEFEKTLVPLLSKGERMPDLALLAQLVLRSVERHLQKLDDAVREDANACRILSQARADRWDAWHRVTAALKSQRSLFSGLAVHPLLTEPVPSESYELRRHAGAVLGVLRNAERWVPQLRGVTIDRERLAAELQPGVDDLGVALEEIVAGQARVSLAKEVKRQAKAAFEADYGNAYRFLEAVAALGGSRIRLLETGFRR